ncbi:bifunctional UDP-sugar hydrolase/5'-nucleotidase UshA [Shewanella marina]|uniref:bifunctional UDP-sugar hydrolase/5'-nucleotidase UshA n=1 Tax=Shewanella marina TaxID=487319 RepID=UPI00046F7410|nr:bifunctional UDP-sugar hydrolase/5'-nucleotidase UshA [Shewanella marina]
MANKLIKAVLATSILAALAGCNDDNDPVVPQSCAEDNNCVKFSVLHTNDNHGRFWQNKNGEYGMAARKTLVDQLRAEIEADGGSSLLLSGGDINTGVPESDLQDAVPDFIGMNLIGYDAMAVGNHEFDNPLHILDMQSMLTDFPMLAANIYKADGTRYFAPYKIFDVNGLRVAVVGMTTDDTAKLGNPEFISELTFTKPAEEMTKVIAEIEAAGGADVIFATTHMGHYADAKHGSNAPGDVTMALATEAGKLHAIFGGHSQNAVCMEPGTDNYADFNPGDSCTPDQQNGTYIMQAKEWGKYVGRANFEHWGGKLHLVDYSLIPVNLKVKNEAGERVFVGDEIVENPDVLASLRPYQEQGQQLLNEVIATTDAKLEGDRAVVRYQQTNLGHLIAMAQSTGDVKTDFAVMNSGGVRASIEAGEISYRDVLTVQPFGNMVTRNSMTGAEVSDYLANVAIKTQGSGAYAQLVNVTMNVDCQAGTVDISDINGKGFAADATYTFTVPSYNAAGGDDYPVLADAIDTGFVDADVLYQFFKAKGTIVAADYAPTGSVVYLNSTSPMGCSAE